MPDKTYNKVVINGNTYMDLSEDTATADTILEGYTAHDRNGAAITGTATETDPIFSASAAHGITSTDISNWNGKQAALVSGTNIKTINSTSILGSGDISITDNKVAQSASTSNAPQPVLFRNNVGTSTGDSTEGARYATAVTITPSTGDISATKFNGYTLAGACAKAVDTSISTNSSSINLPTSSAVASFVEGKGYITGYTETDPTVPSWAKESTKPSYNASEINGAMRVDGSYGNPPYSYSVYGLGSTTTQIPVYYSTQNITNADQVTTKGYVDNAIAALPTPMLFKGSVGTGGTITSLPAAASTNEGYTYKVITDLSSPVTAKVGDTVISNGSTWVVIPSGDEPSGTVTSVGLSNATNGGLTISGSPITSNGSITVGHSNVLTSAQTTQAVYPIKIDKNGHISAYGTAVTIPTKVSDLTNDSGFITGYTETDPTVPAWAKASSKPSYTFAEIGSKPSSLSGYGITDAKIESGTITLGSNTITPLTSFTETDPIFTASDAYGITSSDITNWNGKQAALVSGTNIKTINGDSILGSGDLTITGGTQVQIVRWT